MAWILNDCGDLACQLSDYATALACCDEALALARMSGNQRVTAWSLHSLGNAAVLNGDPATAQADYEGSLEIRREIGDRRGAAETTLALGLLALEAGDDDGERARTLLKEGLTLALDIGDHRQPWPPRWPPPGNTPLIPGLCNWPGPPRPCSTLSKPSSISPIAGFWRR